MPEEKTFTHWRKTRNMTYLGSWDLENMNTDLILTIKSVGMEDVHDPVKNETKQELVAHFFESTKPMVLNATNCKAITKATGSPYMEEWVGHPISIYVEKVKAFGDVFDALRIRKKQPDIKVIVCEMCNKPITPVGGKSPSELAEISKRNCGGKSLCVSCQKKFKADMEKKPEPVKEEEPKEEAKQDPTDGSEDLGW